MFYSQFILAKKGPLGTIWIAAHLERKLRKNQVAETDIGVTVDNILFPEVPIALRLSGHLLLGVVRIYSRQVNYLFNDCSETLGKIKQAFHAAVVDLPPEATTAPFHSITLPETFDFDELELAPDSESSFLHLNGNYVDHHVTTREQITLQDCIENNPYLGSSQFGPDERFGDGDGSYSLLGLDFDEEFLADKARSPSGASTSKPLLKEQIIVPPVECENEVTHMDVDHHCEPLGSEPQKVSADGVVVNNVFECGQIERDDQLNTVGPTNFLDPLNEPAGLKAAPRKDSDFALSKPDTPGFHAYTPRILEACTPDLNQEYCPPDEPSTPALVDETSSPMYQEGVVEGAGRFSPVMLVNPERNSPFEPIPGSLLPQQVSVVTPGASSIQANKGPSPASFQGFPLQQQQSPSPACFQGFLPQQAAPAEVSREAFATQGENDQVLSVTVNAAAVSLSFESFPQPTCLQQIRTSVSHEGGVSLAGASSSLLTSAEGSLAASHQQIGNPSANVNYQWAGTVRQDVSPHFRQQSLAVSPQIGTAVSQEGAVFSAGASSSLLTPPEASLAASHQQIGNPSAIVNNLWAGTAHQEVSPHFRASHEQIGNPSAIVNNLWAGTAHQEVSPHFRQQGLAVSPQIGTAVSHGSAIFPAGACSSLLMSPEASPAASNQQIGNPSVIVNNQWAGTVHPEVSPHFQQQGLRVSPQIGTAVSHEGAVFPAGAFSSFSTSPEASRAASHQQIGNPSAIVNNQWAGMVRQEVSPHFQQQCLAVSPQESSFGFMVGSSALQPLRTMQIASQVIPSPLVSQASVIPSFSASSGSVSPMETVRLSGHTENMDWDKESSHDLAVTKGLLWQSAAQQHNASSSAAMPAISTSIVMGERETLRSANDLPRGTPDFLLLRKDMSDERIPGLELDRYKPFSIGIHGVTKEAILPQLDKTPILREETPFVATPASFFSTHNIDSLPGDDDVLASILGRKSKAFKVVSTPKVPKPPKANVVAKRPRKAPRVTPKKRKIDFDTVAVLHGDVIRQQLANAEDIRRDRRKAPCTRREVWSFIRESEGQENFDEPTLPELSPDLHDLYHDVLHGWESRPPSSALSAATKAKQTLQSETVRSGESDCVVDCVNKDANKLDTRSESDLLVDCVNKDSSKDVSPNEFAGSVENNSLENNAEQLKEDMKVETAQANPCEDSAGSEVVEKLTAENFFTKEDSEGLAGKERDTNSLPELQDSEDHITNSIISRETRENEQAVQDTQLNREIEGTGQAPGDIMVSNYAEKIVGVVGPDVGNECIAMALQQRTENLEEKQQLSSGLNGQNSYDEEEVILSNDADLKALDIPSDGKDATVVPVSDAAEVPVLEAAEVPVSEAAEVPVSEAADMDKGNVEDSYEVPTSNPAEGETNLCRDDEEMAAMEFERDTDFLDDDDNDVAYAEIDYSSDEQDVSIQDSGGWSARSRNVGRYLKTVFEEMESGSKRLEQGATLGLERLLARKTKREAARMFFETLVLKSKDYIHVEQKVAYQDIHLYPRSKLMKTEF